MHWNDNYTYLHNNRWFVSCLPVIFTELTSPIIIFIKASNYSYSPNVHCSFTRYIGCFTKACFVLLLLMRHWRHRHSISNIMSLLYWTVTLYNVLIYNHHYSPLTYYNMTYTPVSFINEQLHFGITVFGTS